MDEARALAEEYLSKLCRALTASLRDPAPVHAHVAENESHAPGFPETRFCKGSILPVVDRVTTEFFSSRLGLTTGAAHSALRCEGASTLADIYTPARGQSGFSDITWGTNYQNSDKSGKAGKFRPCPDFGIVHAGPPRLNILGEVKYAPKSPRRDILLEGIRKDMLYYMGLERTPDLSWHYEFGIGIAYGAAQDTIPVVEILADDWDKRNFFILLFHNTKRGA
jgi:hypothetical protein